MRENKNPSPIQEETMEEIKDLIERAYKIGFAEGKLAGCLETLREVHK